MFSCGKTGNVFFGIMHINIVNILFWSYFPTYFVNDENFLNIEPSPPKKNQSYIEK